MYTFQQRRMLNMSADEYEVMRSDFSKFAFRQYENYLMVFGQLQDQTYTNPDLFPLEIMYNNIAVTWRKLSNNLELDEFKRLLKKVFDLSAEVGVMNPLCGFIKEEEECT